MRKEIFSFGISCLLLAAPSLKTSAATVTKTDHLQLAVEPAALIGRWDITVDINGKPAPAWLEVKLSGYKTLVGYFVSTAGSARPVAEVKFDNGKIGRAHV